MKAELTARRFGKDEDGSLIVFTIFLLILTLLIAGTAIDAMRHETRRVALQNTLDGAILAAASLNQTMDAETLIKEHVSKAGMNPDKITVNSDSTFAAGSSGDLTARSVTVSADVDTPTMFMSMMGIDTLESGMGSAAEEAIMNIEISMIVDISGSMGSNSRMANLKVAAKDFVTHVLTVGPNAARTSISIIPYNATVVVGDDLLSRLNAGGQAVPVTTPMTAHPGALTAYPSEHNDNTCVRFRDADFNQRAIAAPTTLDAGTPLERVAHYRRNNNSWNQPSMNQRWCNENRSSILTHSTSIPDLHAHIDGLTTGGWTGIDNGMKWGVALLDPAMRPAITSMVSAGLLPATVDGRPGIYDPDQTKKIVVLMTDGANTLQRDLKDEFKNGPSRVWHSDASTEFLNSAGNEVNDPELGRNLGFNDGYFVFMPDNAASQRWYRPGNPGTNSDDRYYSEAEVLTITDLEQLDRTELNRRYATRDIADFFFRYSDSDYRNEYRNAETTHDSYGQLDDRLEDICDAANEGARIDVYAIGFEAPSGGQDAMEKCATVPGNYFDVDGKEISDAFAAIAGQITLLRLTN